MCCSFITWCSLMDHTYLNEPEALFKHVWPFGGHQDRVKLYHNFVCLNFELKNQRIFFLQLWKNLLLVKLLFPDTSINSQILFINLLVIKRSKKFLNNSYWNILAKLATFKGIFTTERRIQFAWWLENNVKFTGI